MEQLIFHNPVGGAFTATGLGAPASAMKNAVLACAAGALAFAAIPPPARAQMNCLEFTGAGRDQCLIFNKYATQERARNLLGEMSKTLNAQTNAKRFGPACETAAEMVQLSRDFLPDMLLLTSDLRSTVCKLARR